MENDIVNTLPANVMSRIRQLEGLVADLSHTLDMNLLSCTLSANRQNPLLGQEIVLTATVVQGTQKVPAIGEIVQTDTV